MTAEALVRALGGRWCGDHGLARCRAHQDRTPSLSISDGENGCLLVHCHAGCSQQSVVDSLKRLGHWPEKRSTSTKAKKSRRDGLTLVSPVPNNAPTPPERHRNHGPVSACFEYHDGQGRLMGYRCRFETEKGKTYRPLTLWRDSVGGLAWRWKGLPPPRPLYGLPDLEAHPDIDVLIVEGEKAADAARHLLDHLIVCTWQDGAAAAAKTDWSPLRGRRVTIWPDNDQRGQEAAREVIAELAKIKAAKIQIVELPDGLPEKWDLADLMPGGIDPTEIIRNARRIEPWDCGDPGAENDSSLTSGQAVEKLEHLNPPQLGLVNAVDLCAKQFAEPKFVVPDYLTEGLGILAGKPKIGKSWFALGIVNAVAMGSTAIGKIDVQIGDALYLALEDNERRLQKRLKAVLQGCQPSPRLDLVTEWRRLDDGGIDDLRTWLSAHPDARLIVIDTLAKVRGRSDPDAGIYMSDYDAVSGLKALADEFSVAILLIHHLRKSSADDPLDEVSGSTGLTGAVDFVLVLRRDRIRADAVLFVTGRDLEERETALEFDKETGAWTILGDADEYRQSQARVEIIRALTDAGEPMTPAEVAAAIGKKRESVKVTLSRMAKDGEVQPVGTGKYWIPWAS